MDAELQAIRADLTKIERKLDTALKALENQAKSTRPMSPAEFAQEVGMSVKWVYAQLQAGKIRRLKGYALPKIPRSELVRLTEGATK